MDSWLAEWWACDRGRHMHTGATARRPRPFWLPISWRKGVPKWMTLPDFRWRKIFPDPAVFLRLRRCGQPAGSLLWFAHIQTPQAFARTLIVLHGRACPSSEPLWRCGKEGPCGTSPELPPPLPRLGWWIPGRSLSLIRQFIVRRPNLCGACTFVLDSLCESGVSGK